MSMRPTVCVSIAAVVAWCVFASPAAANPDKATGADQQSSYPATPVRDQLPEGHPPLPGMTGETSAEGTLVIRAIQGTEGGGAVGGERVTVDLYHRGKSLKRIETALDSHGVVMLENLPLVPSVHPFVTVERNGAMFGAIGRAMTPQRPDQVLRLKVYETTDKKPDWQITARHLMLRRTPHGLQVNEVIAVQNPADRAWRGEPVKLDDTKHRTATGSGKPKDTTAASKDDDPPKDPSKAPPEDLATVVIPLPPGATHVQLGEGFHACCTKIHGGNVYHAMPLVPGATRFRFVYRLPMDSGIAALDIAAVAPVKHLMVFVPDDGSTVTAEGLTEKQGMTSDRAMRVYVSQNLDADDKVKLTIQYDKNQSDPANAIGQTGGMGDSASAESAKAVTGLGVGVMLVGAVAFLFKKTRKKDQPAPRRGRELGR